MTEQDKDARIAELERMLKYQKAYYESVFADGAAQIARKNQEIESLRAYKKACEKQEPAFKKHRGDLCEKSTEDDQSFGMWCQVSPDFLLRFDDGTKFYTRPAPLRELTDEEIDACYDDADLSYRKHMSSVRGQMVTHADSFEWHIARSVERAILAKARGE